MISASESCSDLNASTAISLRPAAACPARSWHGSAALGIGPSEFFAGIPGTVGGALAMNAGAHGGETWERVESVRTIDRSGEIHERAPAEYTVGYRSVTGPADEWFIEGTFRFDPDVARARNAG